MIMRFARVVFNSHVRASGSTRHTFVQTFSGVVTERRAPGNARRTVPVTLSAPRKLFTSAVKDVLREKRDERMLVTARDVAGKDHPHGYVYSGVLTRVKG